jgi:hypothetical protein
MWQLYPLLITVKNKYNLASFSNEIPNFKSFLEISKTFHPSPFVFLRYLFKLHSFPCCGWVIGMARLKPKVAGSGLASQTKPLTIIDWLNRTVQCYYLPPGP